MKKTDFPCLCGGKLKWLKEKVVQDGITCGILDVELCEKCGEMYLPEESMRVVENKLKEAGLWGVERKEVKFWKLGNAISIRLPVDLVRKLNLDKIKKGFVYPEGHNKLLIEF